MPSGHVGALMPQRMYFIDPSTATLEGMDLGRPTRCEPNPTIGGVPLPARGTAAAGFTEVSRSTRSPSRRAHRLPGAGASS
jgi:hypothetical protein